VRARIERRAQDVGFRTFGLMRFSTVSFGNTSLAIAAQSAHQAALAELGSSKPVRKRHNRLYIRTKAANRVLSDHAIQEITQSLNAPAGAVRYQAGHAGIHVVESRGWG
jgi:hypothetical protein